MVNKEKQIGVQKAGSNDGKEVKDGKEKLVFCYCDPFHNLCSKINICALFCLIHVYLDECKYQNT